MIQRATHLADDPTLERIVKALVENVQPARVILFGSRARGDARPDSDYDLIVEVGFDDYRECYHRLDKVVRDSGPCVPVDAWPRRPGELEKRGRDPGYMDWDVVREGIVLYPPHAGIELPAPRPRVREAEPYGSIKDWLERADEDLRVVELSLQAGESAAWGAAGFHAQQWAEKYLKVLFVLRDARPPRVHDLKELLAGLRQLGYVLPGFEAECALLRDYAVAVRYPEHLPLPTESRGRAVIAAARRIVDAVSPLVPR